MPYFERLAPGQRIYGSIECNDGCSYIRQPPPDKCSLEFHRLKIAYNNKQPEMKQLLKAYMNCMKNREKNPVNGFRTVVKK